VNGGSEKDIVTKLHARLYSLGVPLGKSCTIECCTEDGETHCEIRNIDRQTCVGPQSTVESAQPGPSQLAPAQRRVIGLQTDRGGHFYDGPDKDGEPRGGNNYGFSIEDITDALRRHDHEW
jgi:hypothetical protein